MKLKVSYFILILILFSIPVYAQDSAAAPQSLADPSAAATEEAVQVDEEDLSINISGEENDTGALTSSTGIGGIIRAIVVFLVVLGAILLLYYILRKTGGSKFQNQQLIKILSSQSLTNNKSLHVVEVGGEFFLIGAADNAVSLISKIEEKETIDSLRLEASNAKPVHKNSFRDILSSVFNKGKLTRDNSGNIDDSAQFIKKQGDRLKNL